MNLSFHAEVLLMASTNLRRYKARAIAVLVPLLLAMAVLSMLIATRGGFVRDATLAAAYLPDITVQTVQAGRIAALEESLAADIARIPGVREVVPRVWGYVPLLLDDGEATFTLMGLDDRQLTATGQVHTSIAAGTFLLPGDRGKALIGQGVAATLAAGVGDRIELTDAFGNGATFEVAGVFSNPVQLYSTDMVVVTNADARSFFGYGAGQVSDLAVYTEPGHDTNAVARAITERSGNVRVLTAAVVSALVTEAFGLRSGTLQAMWLILLLTVLLLVWAQTSHITTEASREIGILRALGWEIGQIIEMKMLENLILGLLGTSAGILAGFLYAQAGTPGIQGFCLGCASVYPKFPVPAYLDLPSLAILFAAGILPLMAAGVVPAWLVGTLDPDEAIRR